jgi:transcription elongation factor Elf1
MINHAFVVDVQDRVAHTQCPSCGNPQLEFELRCELAHAECLFVAKCVRCHLMFEVDADSFVDVTKNAADAGHFRCPTCQTDNATLALDLHTASHSGRYALHCPQCEGARGLPL